jgi:hypothetical protein
MFDDEILLDECYVREIFGAVKMLALLQRSASGAIKTHRFVACSDDDRSVSSGNGAATASCEAAITPRAIAGV